MQKKKNTLNKRRYILPLTVKKFIDDYIYRIDLDADYQREMIWSVKQQNDLLDSIVHDIDIPKMYLVEVKDNKQFDFECIDGKQRMTTLLRFYKPEPNEEAILTVNVLGEKLNYKQLKKNHPTIANKIDGYELSFSIYRSIDDDLIRVIFRRLQLGIRLNSGELLKSRTGAIRDFIFREIGNNGPFFIHSNLSEKRFSRPFTLAQICINSFSKAKTNEFVRARLADIEDFFEEFHDLNKSDENLTRIRNVLKEMDRAFKKDASNISSRAIAVTGYLFIEELYVNEESGQIKEFSKFYLKLIDQIKNNMELLSKYEKPNNPELMEEFQKYILQASVEAYSIKRRHEFLKKAFNYYLDSKTKGRILGSKIS